MKALFYLFVAVLIAMVALMINDDQVAEHPFLFGAGMASYMGLVIMAGLEVIGERL